jgi:hypothetical protein
LSYLHDASALIGCGHSISPAARAAELPLQGIGSILTLDATPDDDVVRVVWTSFVDPQAPESSTRSN